MEKLLFEVERVATSETDLPLPGRPRLLVAERRQVFFRPVDLESLLADDHMARAIWDSVELVDLSQFYADIRAFEGQAGAPAIDPKILLALWLYATSEGVGSARKIARLTEEHDSYRWICGGVSVNYHTLSDFRSGHEAALDKLMTEVLALLCAEGLLELKRVAQDGMRVRASAGASSFRRQTGLERHLEEAKEQIERLKQERDQGEDDLPPRRRAARERAARERLERVRRALDKLPEFEQGLSNERRRRARPAKEVRVSTTDPEARVMKMADGGFRPAYNVQFSSEMNGFIVALEPVNHGTDAAEVPAMLDQIERRRERYPEELLADGGFASRFNIDAAAQREVVLYAPVREPRTAGKDRYAPHPQDNPQAREWRARMGSAEAQAILKQRGAVAEWAFAQARAHTLTQFLVRGLEKVRCVVLFVAITHNLLVRRRLLAASATA